MKKAGLVLLTMILMAAMLAGYHYSQQMTAEEKKAEVLSLLETDDLIDLLGTHGFLKLWNSLPVEQRRTELTSLLRSEDLLALLGPEELLQIRSNGQYDYDYGLVDLAGTKPASLTDRTRKVWMESSLTLEIMGTKQEFLFANGSLGYVYSQEYIVVPTSIFYVYGNSILDLMGLPDIEVSMKLFLLPSPEEEGLFEKEELGDIKFINEEFNIVVIERTNPAITAPPRNYQLGKFEDLEVGHKLYRVSRDGKGNLAVKPSTVIGLTVDRGRNLIDFDGYTITYDLGGLLFALRDGEFELVGFLGVPQPGPDNYMYYKYIDINQIIDYIEGEIGK